MAPPPSNNIPHYFDADREHERTMIKKKMMIKRRRLEEALNQGGYYAVNNANINNPHVHAQNYPHHQNPNVMVLPSHGYLISNKPLAMHEGSRVICKQRGGGGRLLMHGDNGDNGASSAQYCMIVPRTRVWEDEREVKKKKKEDEFGGVNLGLLKEEENVPEGIDLSLKLGWV